MIKIGIDSYTQASFSFRNRMLRTLWACVYLVFVRFSPRPFHSYRVFILRIFGAKLGERCHVYPTAKIWAPWNLDMGDSTCIANDVIVYNIAKVVVGDKAIISQGSHLCTGSHDYTDSNFQLYALPIQIGQMAWVCSDSFIGPGAEIGEGAVIAARSVVTKNMPEWMVCAGVPAKPIKSRVITTK